MPAVNLHAVESRNLRPFRSRAEILHDFLNLFHSQGTGDFIPPLAGAAGCGNRLHSDPGRAGGSARVIELNGNGAALGVKGFAQFKEAGNETILVQTELGCSVGAGGEGDIGVLDNDQSGASPGSLNIVTHVFPADRAIRTGKICSHRHHNSAVLNRQVFYLKR